MRQRVQNSAGFGLTVVVVAIVALVVVGLVGWRLFDASKARPSQQQSNDQNPSNAQIDMAAYLDVKELGIKLKLDNQVRDATYAIQKLDDGSLVARFSTRSLAASDPACGAESGQLGALEKSTMNTDRAGNQLVPDGQTVFKLGDYYYTYAVSQALCSETIRSAVGPAMAAFRESLKTIQLDR